MKRIIIISAIVAMFASCFPYGYDQRIPFAMVHLSVFKEDGTPFKYNEAERFTLQYTKHSYRDTKPVINANDSLIFQCRTEIPIYRKGDSVTNDDIIRALDASYQFTIKDTRGEYKTVKKTYKECYKSYEENPDPKRTYSIPDYIYHCEVKLERK